MVDLHKRHRKIQLAKIQLSDDDESDEEKPKKRKVNFKRIDKSQAKKLKDEEFEIDNNETSDAKEEEEVDEKNKTNTVLKPTRLDILAKKEKESKLNNEDYISDNSLDESDSEISVDRDWYMQDEVESHAYLDTFDDIPDEPKRKPQTNRNKNSSESTWFDSQLAMASGTRHAYENTQETSNDIPIVIHRLTPPFLDVKTVMSQRSGMIDVIRDRTGDLYKFSKNGSNMVNERRKKVDRSRNAKESLDTDNSKMSRIIKKRKTNKVLYREERMNSELEDPHLHRQVLLKQRMKLPAYDVKEQLLKAVHENQVLIVVGETGSGKTTQIPQFLNEAGYSQYGMIGVAQPRRVAAVSVAKRVSDEMNVKLGEEVGFTIRFEDRSSRRTRIKFMTDGILMREALQDSDLDKYSCVIIDEAHERSLDTDILLGLFKQLLRRRRDLKLIVTSATLNSGRFAQFFGNAEQFHIPGRTYPVDIMFSTVPTTDYVDSAIKQTLRVHLGKEEGDILVFMTGQEDIETTCGKLQDELTGLQKLDKEIKPLKVLPIYSTLPADLQSRIFEKSNTRKCIVATNIAETSLTVAGIKFVIDAGLMKLKVFNPRLGMNVLQIAPISLAQANQRAGRAGRTAPGKCFRLYTYHAATKEMFPEPIPEIQRTNLDNTVLLLKSLHVEMLSKFPYLDKPSDEALSTAQYELWSEGALDNFGHLTALGKEMSKYPIEPSLSKMLILSTLSKFRCTNEILTIVAMLSIPPVFIRPTDDLGLQKRSDSVREKFQVAESDHLTLLNIYNQFISHSSSQEWCSRNFLQYRSLRRAKDVRSQLERLVDHSSSQEDWDLIRECICASYFQHAANFKKYGVYQHLRSGLEMALHPTSALYGMGDLPEYVVYHEVLLTGQMQHMNYVTAVKGKWLVEYGSVFYAKRTRGVSTKQHQEEMANKFNKMIEEERNK